eukprot:scaffold133341_cov65-Cyclotella_meneghiniana.AAC.2
MGFISVMAPQRCRRRRCSNSTTRKTLLLCWIAASFSNTNHDLVAVGFGFTTPPTTQWSRLQMGYDDVYDDNDDVSSNEGDSQKKQPRKPRARMKKSVSSAYSSLLPPPAIGKGSNRRRWANIDSHSSPSSRNSGGGNNAAIPKIQSDQTNSNEATDGNVANESQRQGRQRPKSTNKSFSPPATDITREEVLPEWGDLFSSSSSSSQYDEYSDPPSITPTIFPTPVIEGVLPVSELFYRSTQSISSVEDDDERDDDVAGRDSRAGTRTRAKSYKNAETDGETGDDEELPFSAEQSDRLSIPGNKIQIRRNKAEDSSQLLDEIATGIGIGLDGNKIPSEAVRRELKSMARQEQAEQRQLDRRLKQQQNTGQPQENDINHKNVEEGEKSADMASKSAKGIKKKLKGPKGDRSSGRKMVRRGMEMLVGGEPINADPPQRAIELNYFNRHPRLWNRAITLNSPDFGPFLHMHAAGKISKKEVGLYAENFVHNAIKWNVCPDDLKDMVTENELRMRNDNAAAEHASAHRNDTEKTAEDVKSAIQSSLALGGMEADLDGGIIHDDMGGTIMFNPRELEPPKGFGAASKKNKRKRESRGGASGITSKEPNIRPYNKAGDISKDPGLEDLSGDSKLMFTLGGELKFS